MSTACTRRSGFKFNLAAVLITVAATQFRFSQADNTACISKQLTWYTSVVGETPCMTYQRLRQICNNDYQVPILESATTPGDRCDDEISSCCCNTIAYHLSMLCMVCQQDTQDVGGGGRDAPAGTFDVYLRGCGPISNKTLQSNIQAAVCNNDIRIDGFLYDVNWDTGDWFYVISKETAETDHAAYGNNTFTHCPNQISSTATSTTPPLTSTSPLATTTSSTSGLASTSPPSSSNELPKNKSDAPVIEGVLGGLLLLTVIVLAAFIWRHRKPSGRRVEGEFNSHEYSTTSPFPSVQANPLIPNRRGHEGSQPPIVSESEGASEISSNTSNHTRYGSASTEPLVRQADGGPLIPGLARSTVSGTLPPAYDPSWDSDQGPPRRNHPGVGAVSIPPSNLANLNSAFPSRESRKRRQ